MIAAPTGIPYPLHVPLVALSSHELEQLMADMQHVLDLVEVNPNTDAEVKS